MLYAYERIEFPTQPTFLSNKNAIPSGVAYGSGVLTTSVKDNNGIMHYASYFAAKLKVRVAKPAVTTVGGGTSYVKNTETTGDLQKVTSGVTGYDNNKNFVGSSVGTSGVSSYSQTVTNSGAIGKTETDTKYTQTVANTITGSTASSTTVNKFSTTDKYNGLSNVYIIKGKNVRISDISSLPGVTEATTYIVESGNLFIDINIISSKNIAFVVKGGNITIKNTVTHLDGTYISIPVGTTGGKILSSAETATQLVVNGSLYGDITDLVDDRYYIAKSSSGLLSVGTIVSFGSSIFNKPAPLVGQFIGEYLDSTKVAK